MTILHWLYAAFNYIQMAMGVGCALVFVGSSVWQWCFGTRWTPEDDAKMGYRS